MTTQLILLGTGTPNIEPEKYQSSYAVIHGNRSYLIDAGGGAMQRIAQACVHYGLDALEMPNLVRLFLTHLHPDHTTGLADLIIAPWVQGRTESLQIFGPSGTRRLVENLLEAYTVGIGEHLRGLAPINHPLNVEPTEIEAGVVFQDDAATLTAFRVKHGGLDAFGYKVETPDRIIVFSGDTCPVPALVEQASGCDILVHEVYSSEFFKRRTVDWQKYHGSVHTSTSELIQIANAVRPKLLVLVHQLYWGATDGSLLAEIRAGYDGEVVSGHDLDRY